MVNPDLAPLLIVVAAPTVGKVIIYVYALRNTRPTQRPAIITALRSSGSSQMRTKRFIRHRHRRKQESP
jgi:hypothetical protein